MVDERLAKGVSAASIRGRISLARMQPPSHRMQCDSRAGDNLT
jgi:hypothetical protein